MGRIQPKPADSDGIERLDQARALITAEAARSLPADVHRGIRDFQFNQQGDAPLYEGQYLVKRGDRLGSAAKAAGFQFLIGQVF